MLGAFLGDDGHLHTIPSKHAKLMVVLDHLAQSFEPGRRYLVENRFLTREGGVYWRSGGTFEV